MLLDKLKGIIKSLAKPTTTPIQSGPVPVKGVSKEDGERLIQIFQNATRKQPHHQ